MINLNRSKDNKWIMQKNISDSDLLEAFVEGMQKQNNIINNDYLRDQLLNNKTYHGRTDFGNTNTMGVRLSQACFYMFGYKKDGKFLPSPMTDMLLKNAENKDLISLVNLFSMQFPSPYSNTPNNFKIYIGRLFVKLLLDLRIDSKLYIDECIFFLPFLEEMNEEIYESLIKSIIEYRILNHTDKCKLFHQVPSYDDVFSNCTHEMNYYFLRIFEGFGVFDIIEDSNHNQGKLFYFQHGNGSTYRNDSYASRKNTSGYIILNPKIAEKAKILNEKYSVFDTPLTQEVGLTKEEWIRELYEFEPLKYINDIITETNNTEVIEVIKNMVYQSKYGSRDGKTFEDSLKPVFELFRENRNVEIISGAGDTDLLCIMDDGHDDLYKINIDAKTSRTSTQSINPVRITNHLKINGSKYCIIVSPRFCKGVKSDINGFNIVTVEAETLASYCLKDCLNSNDGLADYILLDKLIEKNIGTDFTKILNTIIDNKFEIL